MLFTSWLLWRRRAITIMIMLIIVMIVYNRLHGGHGFKSVFFSGLSLQLL